jgi:transposase
MDPYCPDLRKRVLVAAEASDATQAAIAAAFGVSLSTVEKWLHRKRETGAVHARPQVHGPNRTLQGCTQFIRAQVKQQPDLTLAELGERMAHIQHVKASPSMMCRELQQLGLPRKKVAPCERARNAAGQAPASSLHQTNGHGIQSVVQAFEIHR